ncbi:MAG: protein translocase subunit SecD, partial [Sedimenticola sp.]|nr:protein translocase subunit SecD [Sedimenticola sp.]
MNRYPLWKNILVMVLVLVGLIYALPNVFDQDPSLEISGSRRASVDAQTELTVRTALSESNITIKSTKSGDDKLLVRFEDSESQLRAKEILETTLGGDYTQALTLSTDVPGWLRSMGALPMYLGLDLRGGIHVLIDVDMDAALAQAMERYTGDIRTELRDKKLRGSRPTIEGELIVVRFKEADIRDQAVEVIGDAFRDLVLASKDVDGDYLVEAKLSPTEQRAIKKFALDQNITTLRNRVNALGVSEPVIQQQGDRRIVVQLPGAQDPSKLKELLGATATLEYRLEDTEHSVEDAL